MGTPNFGVWNISVSTFSGINMKPKLEIHVPTLHCKTIDMLFYFAETIGGNIKCIQVHVLQ